MKKRNEQSWTVIRLVRPVLIGAVIGALAGSVVLLAASAIMASVQLPSSAVTPIAYAVLSVAALVGGIVSARLAGQRGLLCGAACGLLLFFVVTLIGLGMGTAVRGTSLLLKAALAVGFGALGGVWGVNLKQRKRR